MTAIDGLKTALTGRYDIDREIGRGGMATVYVAEDVRHARRVAIKVLHPELSAVIGADRFLAEIKTTAALQHPHILPLFDSGSADGLLYYVMPFVEGETLRARLDREKQLPVADALRIANEVASALDYAHRRGIVHRDIKPENILLHEGQALVADFGIALAVQSAGGQRMTQTGLSLGTPQYMSPEQAMGEREITARSDVYSLGAVMYEMLIGEPPFTGPTSQAIVAKVITEQPKSLTAQRQSVPDTVDVAVVTALQKLPADRFGSAAEFATALRDGAALGSDARTPAMVRGSNARDSRLYPILAGALAIVAAAALAGWFTASRRPERTLRFTVQAPTGHRINAGEVGVTMAFSRDGHALMFGSAADGRLYLRRLDQLEATPVGGVRYAWDFAFSPDGKWAAYKVTSGYFRIALDSRDSTAQPTKIADKLSTGGFAWTPSGDIVYPQNPGLVRASGSGSPQQVAAMDTTVDGLWSNPVVLDDGKTVAFNVTPKNTPFGTAADRLALVALSGGTRKLLDIHGRNAIAYRDGIFVYGGEEGRVMGVHLDLATGKTSGRPVALLDNVAFKMFNGVMAALANDGTLAYVIGATTSALELVDEHGASSTLLSNGHLLKAPSISHDGNRIAAYDTRNGAVDIWMFDVRSGVTTKITNSGNSFAPRWARDDRVAFIQAGTYKGRPGGILWTSPDGGGAAERVPGTEERQPGNFSATGDGRYLVVVEQPRTTKQTAPYVAAYAVSLGTNGSRVPLIETTGNVGGVEVSPDGKWLAYQSDESGQNEVYARPFSTGTERVQLSNNGGAEARWSPDGHRVIYRANGAFRSVTLDLGSGQARVARSDSLFPDRWDGAAYAVHPDGKHFVMSSIVGEGPRIVIATNWWAEALAKMRQ
jgi:tRNA A-37 threonylcarbamoyl transferase component Bud32/WD40 repeat protein